jgi:hypothetical protein
MTWQGTVKKEVKAVAGILAACVGVMLAVAGGLAISYKIADYIVRNATEYITLILTLAIFLGGLWAGGFAYEKLRGKKGSAK